MSDSSGSPVYFPPTYDYASMVMSPQEAKMGTDGHFKTLGNDLGGIMGYGDVMVFGGGLQKGHNSALGNRGFVATPATCQPVDALGDDLSGNAVTRHLYIDNIPDGSVPFMTGQGNGGMPKGLVPGMIGDMAQAFDPTDVFEAISMGGSPPCQRVDLKTTDNKGNNTHESRYVVNDDIEKIPACNFNDGYNPVTTKKCKEHFVGGQGTSWWEDWWWWWSKPTRREIVVRPGIGGQKNTWKPRQKLGGGGGIMDTLTIRRGIEGFHIGGQIPDDPVVYFYVVGVAFLGVYLLWCLMMRSERK